MKDLLLPNRQKWADSQLQTKPSAWKAISSLTMFVKLFSHLRFICMKDHCSLLYVIYSFYFFFFYWLRFEFVWVVAQSISFHNHYMIQHYEKFHHRIIDWSGFVCQFYHQYQSAHYLSLFYYILILLECQKCMDVCLCVCTVHCMYDQVWTDNQSW